MQNIAGSKFIVDGMLGKLAVRLRMLGFDTSFYRDAEDSFLLRKSREEGRVLLTRDSSLVKTRGANAFFVSSKILKDQLREVIEKFGLKISAGNLFSRCSVCNEPLQQIAKEKVKGKVPPAVYRISKQFSYCPRCVKYYWKGTHYEKLTDELRDLIQ